ncbi:MerR family transcriptional regulator [Subdoligranulum variabile]|uniref:HTH-type transcriptional regulator HmrR n=1 Tax=Subdoligranulum variabile DSM 15176 TaxID=411471 RepID=D1PLQ2_9FIRM|nr:MerR family transcriptional regulator [Subdoligranulum variabile]EFB76350.1 HTH-type transcriptional regulator HmrR [Subdoligranulum variabile DSM 15176]UWP67906.1 MerR family transcriptional regulator [Subdoligranulum variabile]
MNIKQASEASGVSSRNIRYYEQAGLICPARDPSNEYRIYTEELVRTLKLIRILRMLDMPVEEIRAVLQGSLPLARAAEKQAERLAQQARELETARKFCKELQQHQESAASLDTDACLRRMQETSVSHWCWDWVNDYRAICRAEHRRVFTFTPDTPVTTPAEFTDALFGYARAQGLNLVVTREGMYPHFTIDGIEYRAVRYYASVRGIPTARVRCVCCDPEFAEADVSSWRLRLMKGLHYAAPALFMLGIALLFLGPRGLLSEWWGIAILVSLTAAGISAAWYNAHFYYNDKDNQPHKK